MVPAAIGSERKRHMPTSTTAVTPQPPPPAPSTINDWSSVPKRKLSSISHSRLSYLILLETYPYPQQQTRDYPR